VDPDYLNKLGVIYHQINSQNEVDQLASARNYKNRDEITVSPEKMGDIYEEKVKSFFHEHLHEDEEIRYILDGAGYFDVRSEGDDWVRIWLGKGDLIILPSGIYHRFTTDDKNVSSFSHPCRGYARSRVCDLAALLLMIACSTQRLCACSRTSQSGLHSTGATRPTRTSFAKST
jgi:mannose-6-phosphate isomerase-like protein (cupin superfamily)